MWRHQDFSNTNSESPEKMLSDDMLRFVIVYDLFYPILCPYSNIKRLNPIVNCIRWIGPDSRPDIPRPVSSDINFSLKWIELIFSLKWIELIFNKLRNGILHNDERLFVGQMIFPISCCPTVHKIIPAGDKIIYFIIFTFNFL